MSLLKVLGLSTHFMTEAGAFRAVDHVSFEIARGEVLGIVGESGSGKSVTALSILRLIPEPPGKITGGRILFSPGDESESESESESETKKKDSEGEDLLRVTEARMRQIRGDRIAMIFQDPMTALNPYLRIGEQLIEPLEIHKRMRRKEARARGIEMLAAAGIPDPTSRFEDYPHHLSGGMRQRVLIAMALLCDPVLLIADEPTTALDVTIQAQILDLIEERREALGAAVILITHDLGVVAKMADRIAVMYAGRIVEEGSADDIFNAPRHPYTIALARSIPRIEGPRGGALTPIAGVPPSLAHVPPGCPFHPRCAHAIDVCRREMPEPRAVPGNGEREREREREQEGEGTLRAGKRALHVVRCHVDVKS